MINLIDSYLKINYFGQKIGNKYNVKKGVVNIILFEISFVSSGILIGLIGGLGFTSPVWVSIIMAIYVYVVWSLFYSRIEKNINFEHFEECYQKCEKKTKTNYFILMLFIFGISFLSFFFSMKLIFYLLK